jgi:hypothetical protein
MKSRFLAIAWLLVGLFFALPLAQAGDQCGIGGTGRAAECGIGGTGVRQDGIGGTGHGVSENGVGGTGHASDGIGGTGIVGIITGFGSVWVNGLEVHYDAQAGQSLAIGQLVAIAADQQSGRLQARSISVIHTVSGQISQLDLVAGTLRVLGQTVKLNAETVISPSVGEANLLAGNSFIISGLRIEDGTVVAAYIEPLPTSVESSVVGPVTAVSGNTIEIYGLKINLPNAAAFKIGQEISVSGPVLNGEMQAREVSLSAVSQLLDQATNVELQGFVANSSISGDIKVGNVEVVPPAGAGNWQAGELVHVSGHLTADHRLIADRIEFSREGAERMIPERTVVGRDSQIDHSDHHETPEHHETPDRVDRQELERPEQPEHTDHSQSEKHSHHSEHDHD